jgi:hypothetical protein
LHSKQVKKHTNKSSQTPTQRDIKKFTNQKTYRCNNNLTLSSLSPTALLLLLALQEEDRTRSGEERMEEEG